MIIILLLKKALVFDKGCCRFSVLHIIIMYDRSKVNQLAHNFVEVWRRTLP